MKLTTYIDSLEDLKLFLDTDLDEAILGLKHLSRFGTLELEDFYSISKTLKDKKIKVILEWDILMTESRFNSLEGLLKTLKWDLIDSVRVQDPGAYQYVLEELAHPIQLNLETGNHNLLAQKKWVEHGGKRVERVTISSELPKNKIEEFINSLDVEVEYLGLGRILLFYTPRSLVKPIFGQDEDRFEVQANSEESPHNGFHILENVHGTFMFHPKEHCLLEFLPELIDIKLNYLKIDLRFGKSLKILNSVEALTKDFSKEKAEEFKRSYPSALIRGFFHVNKSNVLFKKLKNQRIKRVDENYLGDVIDVKKKEYMAFSLRNPKRSLKIGDELFINTPEGKVKTLTVNKLRSSNRTDLETANSGDIVYVNHTSGVSIRSAVYFQK